MGSFLSRSVEIHIFNNIRKIILKMMALIVCRSVEIEISNNTQNITLRNPRTYFDCGCCSALPMPELSPGSSASCRFLGSSPFWGVAGVLAFEADSFTLAIHFSNPIDHNTFPMELGLELSPGKAHLGRLQDTYARMAEGTYSSSRLDIQFDHVVIGKNHGTVQVNEGPIQVTATMSRATDSRLEVVLEEKGGLGQAAGTENPCRRRHYQEK